MYVIPPTNSAITLFGPNGKGQIFASKFAALKALGWPWIRDALTSREFRMDGKGRLMGYCPYTFKSESGEELTFADFYTAWRPAARPLKNTWRSWNGEGPVPSTGRLGGGRYFRRPKTIAAKRQSVVLSEYGEPPIRAKRSTSLLPSAWDDYPISAMSDRNWKRFRKHQWKG